jgi:transcription termination/antitermination protein NusA
MPSEQKKIPKSKITELFISTVQKVWEHNSYGELKVYFDPLKNQLGAYQIYQIVEQVRDPSREITSSDKLLQNKQAQIQKNCLLLPVNLKEIINCKKILPSFRENLQKYYQTELYQTFLPWQGKVVEGVVREVHSQHCLVDLLGQKKIGYWEKNEWLPGDIPQLNQSRRFLVKEVKQADSHSIILTRRDEKFLRKLLEIEIPEVAQKKIVIQTILRLPGEISKVIVRSLEPIPNLLGVCIGKGGGRVQNIVQEMNSERIEFVEWQENKDKMLVKLLAPLSEKEISICQSLNHKNKIVVIPAPKKSLVLISKGKLLRLIENYLDLPVKIQIRTSEEMNQERKNKTSFKEN